ncbi:MAG TPA: hypothetical protein VF868_00260 [Bacteroidia bacterium]
MEKKLNIIGYICVGFGILAALLCVIPVAFGVFYAVFAGFLGMVSSSVYVFIDTKHEISKKRLTPGVYGMILSSIPILFMLAIVVIAKLNQ